MGDLQEFRNRFSFNASRARQVGMERESFLARLSDGQVVPRAFEALDHIQNVGDPKLASAIGYELSACQVEIRTVPGQVGNLRTELQSLDRALSCSLSQLGLYALQQEVAPENMPLDVYPDPTGRYERISKTMPREVLLAACRVIGTHIHVGMPDHETALHVYNGVLADVPRLCCLGDGSNGERLAIYRVVAPEADPQPLSSWEEFHSRAKEKGFEEDPRKCWTLVRISVHGTIEFRMFGATSNLNLLHLWARECYDLCVRAAKN